MDFEIRVKLKRKIPLRGIGGGSPKVTQFLGFKLEPSDSNPSLEITSGFEFVTWDVCTSRIRIEWSGSKTKKLDYFNGSQLVLERM